jgi:mono/diheme cytochrome c family protein
VRFLPAAFVLMLVCGCEGEGYPENLSYPARTDPLVVAHAKTDAVSFDRPGEFPNVLFPQLDPKELNDLLVYPANLKSDQRQQLDQALVTVFGTPAHPTVKGTGESAEILQELSKSLKLDDATLAEGSKLYRRHCLHCHGLSGDGRGPTAPWVSPHPRDYRQGRFKFTSSKQEEGERKPRKEDIVRTIREGIEGSSMPSFRLLPDDDQEVLASYVIHLSLRGELEFSVIADALGDKLDASAPNPIDRAVQDYLKLLGGWWQTAQNSLIQPESFATGQSESDYAASVKRGWALFAKQGEAGCISCHTDYGRQSALKYDYWGTVVRPSDLTTGIFRGGRRPIDLFWRIHSGINGTGMTAFGTNLKSQEIWDVVHFLQILPYKAMREKYGVNLLESPQENRP